MRLRTRLLAVVLLLAVAPTVAAGLYNYLSARREAESSLRGEAAGRALSVARRADAELSADESRLRQLAERPALGAYAAAAGQAGPLPEEVRAAAVALVASGGGRVAAVSCLSAPGRALFRVNAPQAGEPTTEPSVQTADFITNTLRHDERVWSLAAPQALRAGAAQEQYGSGVRTTVPVFGPGGDAGRPVAALVMETRLAALFEGADVQEAAAGRQLFAYDEASRVVVYHTNPLLRGQAVGAAVPGFDPAAAEAGYKAGDGSEWLTAARRVEGLGVTVVAAADRGAASGRARSALTLGVLVPLAAGAFALFLVFLLTSRAERRIGRVAEGAAAIAGGNLERRVEVESSGETRVLAESFNLMSDRLREHVRREAEGKQFESFMRLSAILTHDLKNAITGLSMLVSNMDRYYDREGFREDAVTGLRDATDKLRRIVARLNEPVKSLSGEYRRDARQTDLVPVIRRVLAMNAVPAAPLYRIDARLPESLVATVEPERMENVVENLVINALEAMGARGGTLTVEAGEADPDYVFLSVADTGPGMSEEFIRTRLYRPFSTTKTKGIGLGLYTCREVVEAHGGRLEVESEPGVGTRFRVVIPSALFTPRERRRASGADAPPDAAPTTSGAGRA